MKLLLVEDSELIRTRLLAWLRDFSGVRHIDTALTLQQAQDHVRLTQPDIMILDLSLPDGNAMACIPRFKSLAPDLHIVVYTCDADPYSRTHCMAAGANAFFDKSGEISDLLDSIQAWQLARKPTTM